MFVNRITQIVKPGNQRKVVELFKDARAILADPHGSRIYTSYTGPFEAVVYELEVENLAELEAYWAAWWSSPETAAYMEKMNALIVAGTSSEILVVQE